MQNTRPAVQWVWGAAAVGEGVHRTARRHGEQQLGGEGEGAVGRCRM